MHRRDILKASIASMLGITFGYTGTAEGKGFFKKKCGVECSVLASEDTIRFRPDKWGGPNTMGDHTHLTYHIFNRDNDFEASVWDAEIARSFDCWAKVTNLSFELSDDITSCDIIIGSSGRRRSGFGRSGGVLAWAQLPSNREFDGQLWSMFDSAEDWTLSPEEQGILFRAVCAHEIGHLLGLGHSDFDTALMYPYYNPYVEVPQMKDDISRIQKLYGKKV